MAESKDLFDHKEVDWYRSLPRKRMAVGLLLFRGDNLLIVKPNYRDHWLVPGGVIETNESPHDACIREVREELGLNLLPIKLLVVDHVADENGKGDCVHFIFDGGQLNDHNLTRIRLQTSELTDYQFAPPSEALPKLGEKLRKRVSAAIHLSTQGHLCYLENGRGIFEG